MQRNIEKYYEEFGGMVLRRAEFLLKDADRAEDVLHEVFIRLMNYKKKIIPDTAFSLLYRMTTNLCLNMIRDRKRQADLPGDDLFSRIADSDDTVERSFDSDLLDRIFTREKESTRAIAVMHYIDGMTYDEVARECGMSVSGVRKRLRILKEHVRDLEELQ